jgi:selenocysteine-specific elongation factor
MHPVVVGTAGHIDHGKTALVRRLTGIDTDRLKEEKDRGISIDLGFAHLALPSGRRIAIVDVPGHERFVKNMLAGATGVDLVLLVVAADEGVMPQTREHLAIVDLLHVTRGVVALTKADLASPERIRSATAEVSELLKGSALSGSPIVPVSSVTGAGIDELLEALDRAAAGTEGREARGAARLPVDRVFSIEGIGTVVTGTLWSGTVRSGDSLVLLPSGRAVRARQVEVHDQAVDAAVAGNRTAVAIHGVSRDEVARGEWLLTPGRFRVTAMLDVRLNQIGAAESPLKNRTRVRVHLGASETLARVVLYESESLAPGASAFAQLRLEGSVVAVPGDRLVIRSYSPSITIGGATVIDSMPVRRARLDAEGRARLGTLESGSLAERFTVLVGESGHHGLSPEAAALRLGVDPEDLVAAAAQAADLFRVRDGRFLSRREWAKALDRVVAAVRDHGEEHKLRHGISKGELKSQLKRELEGAVFDEALGTAIHEGRLEAAGDRVSLPQAGPILTAEESSALERVERRLGSSGFQVPDISEVLKDLPPGVKPGEVVRHILEAGRAVKVTSELLYPTPLWVEIETRVRAHFARRPSLTMSEFKELLQVSRKYAVPILEHLDRSGLTRREGDVRSPGPRSRE